MDLDKALATVRKSSEVLAERRRVRVPAEHAEDIERFRRRIEAAELQARELAVELGGFFLEKNCLKGAGSALQNPGNAHELLMLFEQWVSSSGFILPPRESAPAGSPTP